jgi:RNA polymerase sigma-70 factor (ECF subfamily)
MTLGFSTLAGGQFRMLTTAANRQPAAAAYFREAGGSAFRAFSLSLLRIEAGEIADISGFDAGVFSAFGLPTAV